MTEEEKVDFMQIIKEHFELEAKQDAEAKAAVGYSLMTD